MYRAKCLAVFGLFLILGFQTTLSASGEQMGGSGKVVEGLQFSSDLLGKDVSYVVYLPQDYETSTRRYPVVFLLHGFTDKEWAWVQFGEVQVSADQMIAAGKIPPMIIVMPDGGITWYVNDHSEKVPYEKMFVDELIPHIDRTFRTRPKKEFRGISGLSMGGFGSLILSMAQS